MQNLRLESNFVDSLPADPITENYRREVTGACYSIALPKKTKNPTLLAYSPEVANLLDFQNEFCNSKSFLEIFSGNKISDGGQPYAMCYGGHQFGNWAGQLGDGRAINLGELKNSSGESWALQLKGSGETPYSRGADGLAVLRSSIREFLCSEAMFHLGVPTTRALSLVSTGEEVLRDMFYDGNARLEPGAVVCRVAPNFIRFGNFEIVAARGDKDLLKRLINYTIEHHFGSIWEGFAKRTEHQADLYSAWFHDVCEKTAILVCDWMRYGFVHGVMNTDNMSISGLTIDFGPYGWLDGYDPMWTPNTTDAQGKRYCYGRQPDIALWNLVQLANALYTVFSNEEALQSGLELYRNTYSKKWHAELGKKIGLTKVEKDDKTLFEGMLSVLQATETDWTLFFRLLAKIKLSEKTPAFSEACKTLEPAFYGSVKGNENYKSLLEDWLQRYHERISREMTNQREREQLMNSVNPKFILRNYVTQIAIDEASEGNYSTLNELLDILKTPFSENIDPDQKFTLQRPEWAKNKPGCSMLSCSS